MIILKIDELQPGMVLASSVYNQQELLLLEKDTSLTKRHIWMLKTWGINQVSVKGKPKKEGKTDFETEQKTKETIDKELKEKFADVIDDPVMEEIMKSASKYLQNYSSSNEKRNEAT